MHLRTNISGVCEELNPIHHFWTAPSYELPLAATSPPGCFIKYIVSNMRSPPLERREHGLNKACSLDLEAKNFVLFLEAQEIC